MAGLFATILRYSSSRAGVIGIFFGNDVALLVPHDLPLQYEINQSFKSFVACHIKLLPAFAQLVMKRAR
ncbi:MAG TPA: hypothetical protein VNY07_06155 [Chthoniobacterales bacterium]|nr:hypothetical protein [Chthoniobacterales bacterium]